MRFLILSLLLCGLAAVSLAQSPFPETVYGARPGAFATRSLGLGHTFLTDQAGPAALAGNPATLTAQTTRWQFELNGDLANARLVDQTR